MDTPETPTQPTTPARDPVTGQFLAPVRTKRLKNGAVYDLDKKQIVSNPPGGPTTAVTSQSQAVAMARLRWDKAREAAAEGMLRGVVKSGIVQIDPRAVPVDAWGVLIEHSAELAVTSDNPRGVAELTRFVGHSAGMVPMQHERVDDPAPGYARLDVPVDGLLELLRQLRAEQAQRGQDIPEQE